MTYMDKRINLAAKARGQILQEVTIFEQMIEIYLSMYYAQKGKQIDFKSAFLQKMGFRNKVETFVYTITKYQNQFKINNPNYKKDLNAILKIRNIVAHEVLNPIGEDYDTKGVLEFNNLRKTPKITPYSEEQISAHINSIIKYTFEVQKLITEK